MKKLLLTLLTGLAIMLFGIVYAFETDVVTFYQSATTSVWDTATTGYAKAVKPLTTWTCQADTTTTTALSLKVVGNIIGSNYATSTHIASTTCDGTDLVKSNICMFHFTTRPVLNMRIDTTTITGTTTKVTCLGIE